MLVQIGTCTDDPRKIEKTFIPAGYVQAQPYEEVDIINPRLLLDYSDNWTKSNYFYVPTWGRYYFIHNIDLLPGGKMVITGHVDVLKTYAEQIKTTQALILRSSDGSARGNYIADATIPMDTQNVTQNIQFSKNPFGNGMYVLTVLGG